CAGMAAAQPTPNGAPAAETPANRLSSTLTEPALVVEQLAGRGITFQYQCVHDLSKAPMGAPGDQDWFSRYSSDLTATIDGHKAIGWSGGTIFLHGKEHQQLFGRVYDGFAQTPSNIDAAPLLMLYEAWAQQSMFDEKLGMKAGRIDANTDFDVVSTAADFLNSSMGYSPTIMEF